MLKIAICDDEEFYCEAIMSYLQKIECEWKDEFEIVLFKRGEDLYKTLKNSVFDIILLDIIMSNLDGIETAKKIRSISEDIKIIFISSYDDRLRDLFRVRPIAFIDKPINEGLLKNALRDAYNMIKDNEENVFIYEKNKIKLFVYLREVIAFESIRNTIVIYTTKEKIQYKDTLKNIWNNLQHNSDFIMPSKSYICNLRHVSMRSNTIYESIYSLIINIGRVYKSETYDRYLAYMERRIDYHEH